MTTHIERERASEREVKTKTTKLNKIKEKFKVSMQKTVAFFLQNCVFFLFNKILKTTIENKIL